jgi:hypothetical protein
MAIGWSIPLERFPAKWKPVRVKKTRQNKNLEPRSDSIGTEKALGAEQAGDHERRPHLQAIVSGQGRGMKRTKKAEARASAL